MFCAETEVTGGEDIFLDGIAIVFALLVMTWTVDVGVKMVLVGNCSFGDEETATIFWDWVEVGRYAR